MLLRIVMQLVPNKIPEPHLLISMDTEEASSAANRAACLRQIQTAPECGGRSPVLLLIGLGVVTVSAVGVIGWQLFGGIADQAFPTFIRARTTRLADTGSSEIAPVVVVRLSPDMVRVSAIALGHPRLAVINGKTVAEGDNVTLQAPRSSVALILRVIKITDGSIALSDGKKTFSAQLIIPSPPQPKAL